MGALVHGQKNTDRNEFFYLKNHTVTRNQPLSEQEALENASQ
jgi:hypothetical protein